MQKINSKKFIRSELELKDKAREIRRLIIRMLSEAGSGHVEGCLSAADIVTALYFHQMQHNPEKPDWPERDRFILCKGHCAPLLYAVLAECGYFDSVKNNMKKRER